MAIPFPYGKNKIFFLDQNFSILGSFGEIHGHKLGGFQGINLWRAFKKSL